MDDDNLKRWLTPLLHELEEINGRLKDIEGTSDSRPRIKLESKNQTGRMQINTIPDDDDDDDFV